MNINNQECDTAIFVIYKITDELNGMIYIGQTIRYASNYFGSGKLIKKAIRQYGIHNFHREVLEYCQSGEEMDERERYWIQYFDCIFPRGYNLADGGYQWSQTIKLRSGIYRKRHGLFCVKSLEQWWWKNYHKLCITCTKYCKQSDRVKIIECPQYTHIDSSV